MESSRRSISARMEAEEGLWRGETEREWRREEGEKGRGRRECRSERAWE